jgi:hypothetical protein
MLTGILQICRDSEKNNFVMYTKSNVNGKSMNSGWIPLERLYQDHYFESVISRFKLEFIYDNYRTIPQV